MSKPRAIKYSHEVIPLRNVIDGIGITPDHHLVLVKLGGFEPSLFSDGELEYLQAGIAQQYDNLGSAFSSYQCSTTHNLGIIGNQYRQLQVEAMQADPPDMVALKLNQLDLRHIEIVERNNPPVRRESYQVAPVSRTAGNRLAGSLDFGLLQFSDMRRIARERASEFRAWVNRSETIDKRDRRLRDQRNEGIDENTAYNLQRVSRGLVGSWNALGVQTEAATQLDWYRILSRALGGSLEPNRPFLEQVCGEINRSDPRALEITRYGEGGRDTWYTTSVVAASTPTLMPMGMLRPLLHMGLWRTEIAAHFAPIAPGAMMHILSKTSDGISKSRERDMLDMMTAIDVLRRDMAATRRVYRGSLCVAISSPDLDQLMQQRKEVTDVLANMGWRAFAQDLDQLNAYLSVLPFGQNVLLKNIWLRFAGSEYRRTLRSYNAAAMVLNLGSEVQHPAGIYVGLSEHQTAVIIDDRSFSTAGHTVVIGKTGYGKTFGQIVKIARKRIVKKGRRTIIVDPQGGFLPGVNDMGGTVIEFTPKSGKVINCMDRWAGGNMMPISDKRSYLNGLFALMSKVDNLDADSQPANGQALKHLYNHFEHGDRSLQTIHNTLLGMRYYHKSHNQPHYLRQLKLAEVMARLKVIYASLEADYNLSAQIEATMVRQTARPTNRLDYWRMSEAERTYHRAPAVNEEYTTQPEALPANIYRACLERIIDDATLAGLLAKLTESERVVMYRILTLELRRGIPTLFDHWIFLFAHGGAGAQLAYRLTDYIDPEILGNIFDGATNVPLNNDTLLICFSLRGTDPQDWGLYMYVILGYVWNRIVDVIQETDLYIDEFQAMMRAGSVEVANFAAIMAMRGRAFLLALTVMSQTIGPFVTTEQGLEIMANAALVEVYKQDKPGPLAQLKEALDFSDGQIERIKMLAKGWFLLHTDRREVMLTHWEVSEEEEAHWRTKLADREQQEAESREAAAYWLEWEAGLQTEAVAA